MRFTSRSLKKLSFSRPQLAIFILAFAIIGYLVFKSFAASNPNLPGDLNNDNTVNAQDLSLLLSNYGTTNPAGDVNSDGTVNAIDLSILLSHYGSSYTPTSNWPLYGVSTGYPIMNRTSAMQDWELSQVVADGAKIVRLDYAEPTKANIVINKALAQGLQIDLDIGGTVTYSASLSTATYASSCSTAATTYKGKIRFYEVMNEPDSNGWTADTYVPFLEACYNAIKAADPSAVVWHGGMWDGNQATTFLIDWMAREYTLGAKNYFDAFNFHCYDDPALHGPWQIWDMVYGSGGAGYYDSQNIRSIMNSNGDSAKPIVCTEGGANANKSGASYQATAVTDAMNEVDGIGTGNRKLKSFFVFDQLDTVAGYGMMYPDTAGTIVAPDGTHWSKRPSWTSYHNIAGSP